MNKHIHYKDNISTVLVPASKSDAQRAVLCAALSETSTTIKNIGRNNDVLFLLELIKNLGAEIIKTPNSITIIPNKTPISNTLNVGESGLATRMVTSVASLFFEEYIITGEGSILDRSMHWFEKYLPNFGLKVVSNNGFLPLQIIGTIKGGEFTIDGSQSSQYVTGLLLTLPKCIDDSIINVENSTSKPYLDLTLKVLEKFGIEIKHSNYEKYYIKGYQTFNLKDEFYVVEGDYSGAAFWIVYGLLNNGITIKGLDQHSTQADKKILEVVKEIGSDYKWINGDLKIIPNSLVPFNFNAEQCPDLFPILVVLAAGINGESIIEGTNRLTNKESNRAKVLVNEFSKLGLDIKNNDNKLIINGKTFLNSGKINSNNDHRIAMAGAIASTLTKEGIEIMNSECVNKSYPEFWDIYKN